MRMMAASALAAANKMLLSHRVCAVEATFSAWTIVVLTHMGRVTVPYRIVRYRICAILVVLEPSCEDYRYVLCDYVTIAMRKLIIAIDGPVGSGKSTAARRVAELLGYTYIDTGAMYRAVALKALRRKIALDATGEA